MIRDGEGAVWDPMTTVSLKLFSEFALWHYLFYALLISQPSTKRARHEFPFEEEYRSAFQAAVGALDTTEWLLQQAPAPTWLPVELETLKEKIEKLKCCIPEGNIRMASD